MLTTWTRIHATLGAPRGPLTYSLVEQAVVAQVPEADDLDYKATKRTDEDGRAEFGKDLASMANSGGGLLVIGVGESGTGAAQRITHSDVELTPQLEQYVHQINASKVRPLIEGLDVQRIENPARAGQGVLSVYVPASPDAPHFALRRDGAWAAPRRNGPHTIWLSEREIERAYADRFARRENEEARLDHVRSDVVKRLGGGEPWLVGVAVPRNPPSPLLPSPTAQQVTDAVTRAIALDHESVWLDALPNTGDGQDLMRRYRPLGQELSGYAINPRKGLRRWVIRKTADALDDAYAELHHDGAVAFAVPLRAHPNLREAEPDTSFVRVSMVERGVTTLVGLAAAWAEARSIGGAIAAQVTVMPRPDVPTSVMKAVAPEELEGWSFGEQVVPATIALDHLVPAATDLLDPLDREDRRATSLQVAEDVLHQFGVRNLEILRDHNA